MTARMIENRLIDLRFRNAHPLHFHSRPEFVYTLHEGKLAVRRRRAHPGGQPQRAVPARAAVDGRDSFAPHRRSVPDLAGRHAAAKHVVVVPSGGHLSRQRGAALLRGRAAPGIRATRVQPPLAMRVGVDARSDRRSRAPQAHASAGRARAAVRVHLQGSAPVAHLETARRVIARQTPVLLCGETGSGKEVFARAVHDASPHAGGAFVAVNCASLPESLIEAELFGYRAGAFTGAQRTGRRGKILQADGGTLFLDEIADMPLDLQARLLRVLDERQVTPLGTEDTHRGGLPARSAPATSTCRRWCAKGASARTCTTAWPASSCILPPLRERSDQRELIRQHAGQRSGGRVR